MYEEKTEKVFYSWIQDKPSLANNYEMILEDIHINLQNIEEKLSPVLNIYPEEAAKESMSSTRQTEQLLWILRRVKALNKAIYL